jgi:hypothetical protein
MSEELQPESITSLLGIQPTHTQVRGELPCPTAKRHFKSSGWFLESAGHVESRDSRHHLDWLLSHLQGKAPVIAKLKEQGHLVDLCIRWDSVGQGGPTFYPRQMAQLGELGIELWLDIYFAGNDSAG